MRPQTKAVAVTTPTATKIMAAFAGFPVKTRGGTIPGEGCDAGKVRPFCDEAIWINDDDMLFDCS